MGCHKRSPRIYRALARVECQCIIPAKRGKSTWQLHGIRAQMRDHFPRRLYRRRALVETVFSAAKRKLSSRAPGRLPVTQHLQTLLLGLAYDIYHVRRALVPFAS